MLKRDAKKTKKIYLSYGWNIHFQKCHDNAQQYFNYLIRGSLRKLYKYPVKPRKYWETLLYKDLLNNLSCLHAFHQIFLPSRKEIFLLFRKQI